MKKIVIASGNKGKIKEVKDIFKEFEIISINNFKIDVKIEEDGKTFEENAMKKAKETAIKINENMNEQVWCLADDSGIEVEYLDGFPGVNTKRWFDGTDRERNLALIEKLKGVSKEDRKVNFVVAIALSNGIDNITAIGKIQGFIANDPKGENGFGFDEIFELEDGRTLAEISQEEKNEISARKIALEVLKQKLNV